MGEVRVVEGKGEVVSGKIGCSAGEKKPYHVCQVNSTFTCTRRIKPSTLYRDSNLSI